MIATSTPSKNLYDPRVNPAANLSTYVIQSGPFTGMTLQQAMQYKQQMDQQTQQVFGPKKPSYLTGSSQGDSALGLLGGIGGAAAIKYGLGQLGSTAAGTAGSATASGAGASSLGGLAPSIPTTVSAGSGSVGVGGAASAAAPSSGLLATAPGSMGASVLPFAGIAAGAGTGFLQGKGIYDAVKGKNMSLASQAALALPTFGASFLYNPLFGKSKNKQEQMARKQDRRTAQNAGLMGPDSRSVYDLGNGNNFDIREFKKNTGKDAYNIDFNPNDADQSVRVGAANALAAALTGGDKKRTSDMAGELYNANSSNGDYWANLKSMADRAGGVQGLSQALNNLKGDNKNAFLAGLDSIYNTNSRNTILNNTKASMPDAVKPVDRNAGKPAPQNFGPVKQNAKPIPKGGKK